MKAIIYREYGPASVLRLAEVDQPVPADDQVLIQVHAASVNSLDWRFMRAAPFLVRLGGGLLRPKEPRLGADVAGRIEAVGKNVRLFKPGDEVFGDVFPGAFAEYVCTGEKKVVHKPVSVSFEAAATAPVAGLTALQGLRDAGKLQSGQKVLINGASGGVGTFAVQIAKSFGAEVTGVCRTRNLEMVRSIGADHVVDYTREDFTRSGRRYDLILDVAANHSVFALRRALTPRGIYVMAGFSTLPHLLHVMSLGRWISRPDGQRFGSMGTAEVNPPDLKVLAGLLESGKVVPVIDDRYPLSRTAEALRYFEVEHARGKVVITVAA